MPIERPTVFRWLRVTAAAAIVAWLASRAGLAEIARQFSGIDLGLLAAAVLTGERCRFRNVPEIEDVRVLAEVLQDLGVVVDHPAHGVYEIAAGDVDWLFIPLEAAAKMRASFILLGPLLARFGRVIISNPGGDRIGLPPLAEQVFDGGGAQRAIRKTLHPGRGGAGVGLRPALDDGHQRVV